MRGRNNEVVCFQPSTSGSVPDVSHTTHLDIVPPPPLDELCFPSPPPPSPLPSTPPPPTTLTTHLSHPIASVGGGCVPAGSRPPRSACEWGYTDQRGGNYTTHGHLVYAPAPVSFTPATYTPASIPYLPTTSPGASSSGYSSGASRLSYPIHSTSSTLPRLPPPPLPPPNLAPPLPPPNMPPPPQSYNYSNNLQRLVMSIHLKHIF